MSQMLTNIMLALTITVAVIMLFRYIANWYRFQLCLREGDEDSLRQLIAEQNCWIFRHGICIAGAYAMVAAIRFLHTEDYENLVRSITGYAIMSFMFVFVESVMAQWLENRIEAIQTEQQVFDSE